MGNRKYKFLETIINESIEAPAVIMPAMTATDCRRLIQMLDQYIQTRENLRPYFARITSSNDYRNRSNPKKISLDRFHSEVKRCWEELPKGFVKDLYTLYYYPVSDLVVSSSSFMLHASYRILVQSNKPLIKILTEGSNLKSTMIVRSLVLFYLIQLAKINLFSHENTMRSEPSAVFGEGLLVGEVSDKFEEIINTVQNSKLKEIMLGDAVQDAARADQAMSEEMQLRLTTSIAQEAGKSHRKDLLNRFVGKLLKIDLSLQELGNWIEILLKKSSGYFESKLEKRYVHLLDADDGQMLESELHLLHPRLRNIFWDDLSVPIRTRKGKVNLYIDISGSMDATIYKSAEGDKVSSLDFAKALACEMSKKRLINEVFLFNNHINSYQHDPESLAKIIAIGGTDISKVVAHINDKKENSIIITDACDRCALYSEHAYFIGVKGASFRVFGKEAMAKYSFNNQAVLFDGNNVFDLDSNGEIVKTVSGTQALPILPLRA